MGRAAESGPRALVRLTVLFGIQLITIALIIRVIGAWFGAGRFNPWVRWTYALTDWIVEPLRRVVPPFGIIDVSPLVAWLILQFLILPIAMAIL
jgi:YggT family protein